MSSPALLTEVSQYCSIGGKEIFDNIQSTIATSSGLNIRSKTTRKDEETSPNRNLGIPCRDGLSAKKSVAVLFNEEIEQICQDPQFTGTSQHIDYVKNLFV